MVKLRHWLWWSGALGSMLALACGSGGSGHEPDGSASAAGPTGAMSLSSSGGASTTSASEGTTGASNTAAAASSTTTATSSTTTATSSTTTATSLTTTGEATTSMGGGAGTTTDAGITSTTSTTITGGTGGTATTGGDCSSLPICEDFEAGTPGSPATIGALTARTEGDGSVVFDSDAYESSVSVRAQGQMAYLVNSDVVAGASGQLYVRAYMKLGEAVSSNHVGYIALSGGINMEGAEMRFGGQNGQLHFNESTGDGLAPDPFEYPECTECITLTPNQWTCVEVMYDYQNQVATAWVGAESFTADEATDFHSGSVTWPSTPSEVKIGFRAWGGTNTVWYDNVAVAYDRIGCDQL